MTNQYPAFDLSVLGVSKRVLSHLSQTWPRFYPYLFMVFAMWFGYFAVLKALLLPLSFINGSPDSVVELTRSLDPGIFWISAVLSIVAVIRASVFSAWPVTIGLAATFVLMAAQLIPHWSYGIEPAFYAWVFTVVTSAIFALARKAA